MLPDALRERGAEVDVLDLYETVAEPLEPAALQAARRADYITFTSSSTVRFFLQGAGGEAGLSPDCRVVSIGPVTSATLREHGLARHVEAERHDIDGMIAALLADAHILSTSRCHATAHHHRSSRSSPTTATTTSSWASATG